MAGVFLWLDQKFLFVYSKIYSKRPLTFCILKKKEKVMIDLRITAENL